MTYPEYEAMPPIGNRMICYWRGHGILGVYSSDSGEDYEEWKEDPWYYLEESKRLEQHAEHSQEGDVNTGKEDEGLTLTTLTSKDTEKECSHPDQYTETDGGNNGSTQLDTAPQQSPTIKTQEETEKREEEKNESSSVEPEWGSSTFEPEWGRTKPKDKREIENDLKEWETTNKNGTMKTSTPIYRHGRCHICERFTSTTN